MTGVPFRVQRGGGWEPVEIEHLTPDERRLLLEPASKEKLLSLVEILCAAIRRAEGLP